MGKFVVLCIGLFAATGLAGQRLINTGHLNHLYDEVKVQGKTLGTVWIYCSAPDFQRVADDDEGFTCVDDVSRALIVYIREYDKKPTDELKVKIERLTDFIIHMADGKGLWYNFMWPGGDINQRHINSAAAPNFWTWRAYWALSEAEGLKIPGWEARQGAIDRLCHATESVIDTLLKKHNTKDQSLEFEQSKLLTLPGGDQLAVMLMALVNRYKEKKNEQCLSLIYMAANALAGGCMGDKEIPPYGAIMCWGNYWHGWGSAQQLALLKAYTVTGEKKYLEKALLGIKHFYTWLESQHFPSSMQWARSAYTWHWTAIEAYPQIAYGFSPLVMAATEAYHVTSDPWYAHFAVRLASWFSGNNKPGIQMYNPATGICFDGINGDGKYNQNAGAESTIEALLAMQALESIAAKDNTLKPIIYALYQSKDGRN